MYLIHKKISILIILFSLFYISCNSELKKEEKDHYSIQSLTYADSVLIYKYRAELANIDFDVKQMSHLFAWTIDGVNLNSAGRGFERINHINKYYIYQEPYHFHTNISRTSRGGKYFLNLSIQWVGKKDVANITHITIKADSLRFKIENPEMKKQENLWFMDIACIKEKDITMLERVAQSKDVKIKFETSGKDLTDYLALSKENLEALHDTQKLFSLLKEKESLEQKLLDIGVDTR